MVAAVPPADVDRTLAVLAAHHVDAWIAGEVQRSKGSGGTARLAGSHPA
jgi:phosphoribosylformylglycinamidine cyclo-ligase